MGAKSRPRSIRAPTYVKSAEKIWFRVNYAASHRTARRENSNLDSNSRRNQSLSAVGLFGLPRKLPISIAGCGGTAWHLLGSHEPPCHLRRRPVSREGLKMQSSGLRGAYPDRPEISVRAEWARRWSAWT